MDWNRLNPIAQIQAAYELATQKPQQQTQQQSFPMYDYGVIAGSDSGAGYNPYVYAQAQQGRSTPIGVSPTAHLQQQQQQPQPQPQSRPTSRGAIEAGINPNDFEAQRLWEERAAAERARWENETRNQINSGYDNYFRELDGLYGNLDPQRQSQEGVATNNFNQSMSDINASQQQNQALLNKQRQTTEQGRAKNLRELTENLANQYQAGQVYLGSMGAGDSSAANQYSYALTKLGTKAQGNIQEQTNNILGNINDKEAQLAGIVTQEKSRLENEFNNQKLQIAQWFNEAQNQIRQMKASGELNKGKDLAALSSQLLNYALGELSRVNDFTRQRQMQLETWAEQNRQRIASTNASLAALGSYNPAQPQFQGINGSISNMPSAVTAGPLGFGQAPAPEKEKSLFDLFGFGR